MLVSWGEFDHTEEPGLYPYQDGKLLITEEELLTWRDHPGARFKVLPPVLHEGVTHYALGDYELPADKD